MPSLSIAQGELPPTGRSELHIHHFSEDGARDISQRQQGLREKKGDKLLSFRKRNR